MPARSGRVSIQLLSLLRLMFWPVERSAATQSQSVNFEVRVAQVPEPETNAMMLGDSPCWDGAFAVPLVDQNRQESAVGATPRIALPGALHSI